MARRELTRGGGVHVRALSLWLLLAVLPVSLMAERLEDELGRSETRVRSAPFEIVPGRTVQEYDLASRLENQGYERVHGRPERPGEYFWGHEVFWIYRRAHRLDGEDYPAALVGLKLRREDGLILTPVEPEDADSKGKADDPPDVWLEPELLAESLGGDRALGLRLDFKSLPEHVWRPLLAAEDARFFDHIGVDGRSLARALIANVRSGKVAQGGSTITQQLIKNRDLTPKRSLGRKMSEALRSLWVEAEYDKEEILEAYLNQVYLGHVDGLAIHGYATASRVYFSKPVGQLNLAEAALLAAIIQGPNRLSPVRHPERAAARRDWVLSRLDELDWVPSAEIERAKASPVRLRQSSPRRPIASHFLAWTETEAENLAPRRVEKGRGLVVETELDPHLQRLAEDEVRQGLSRLRRSRELRSAPLGVALVTLDASTGAVLAYVGGDPDAPSGSFDRARQARRQPGSTVKPLILLEAFEDCGRRGPLHPASRVADEPLRMTLPTGDWQPENSDGQFAGVVDIRRALSRSLNIPFVRIGEWCGFSSVARRMERAGMSLPSDPPPSFTLGSVETTALELAGAYTALAAGGEAFEPRPIRRIERPKGDRLERVAPNGRRVASPETAYLITDLMRQAVREGTARASAIEGVDVAAKTGTSSDQRDVWLAGHAAGMVTVLWIGRDDGERLGRSAGQLAAPLWRSFMEKAVRARPRDREERPHGIVTAYVDGRTGLRVRRSNRRAYAEIFRRGVLPPRDRFWRSDQPAMVIR